MKKVLKGITLGNIIIAIDLLFNRISLFGSGFDPQRVTNVLIIYLACLAFVVYWE